MIWAIILILMVALVVDYISPHLDKFKLGPRIRLEENDDGWWVYSKDWRSIIDFVDEWNENIHVHNEVTLYDLPGIYWNQPLQKVNIDGRPPHQNGYIYKLALPPISDSWEEVARKDDHEC